MACFCIDLKWKPADYKRLLVGEYKAIVAVADERNKDSG